MVLEDKLADPAPKKPLALTIGAAAVTLAVIIGVLAGPSVVSCFNSEDGMGVCLRGKMTDAGILPRQAVASSDAAAPAPEQVAVVTPEADTAVGEPALDIEPAEAPENLIGATFGLLRAEPDGSVVIAGSGTPGSEIEIYSDDNLLGTATVEPSGDWVFVPDAPIVPGGTEITLAEAGKPGRAAQSFVVVINDDKSSEPLVVASTPGAASDVLQGLNRPAVDTTTQVAAADPVAPPTTASTAAATPTATPQPVVPPAPTPAAPAATTAQTPPADPTPEAPAPSAPAATPAAPATTPPQPAATPSATAAAPLVTPPTAPTATTASATPSPATTAAPSAAPAATSAPAVAAVPTTPVAPAVVAVAPTIDAIEIEGDRTFFAGAGTAGATIRLYVDDSFIADSAVEDGRWLVEGGNVLTKPNQRVRIDMLEAGKAEVSSRAEVNFEVELPAAATPTAVAEADPTPAPTVPVVPNDTPAATAATETTQAPTAVDAPAADVPTMVAVSIGEPDSERFASGKAIIRRGDNLWTIARRVYGEGIRYTTIYEANTGQIRDPNRIYPGQVFELPN